MTTKFIGVDIWADMWSVVGSESIRAAIGYVGADAANYLELVEGDSIVVDMSKSAVSRGATNPLGLLHWLDLGATVRSLQNLHAKVILIGNQTAVVSSANVSKNSAQSLIEAGLVSDDPTVLEQVSAFLDQLEFDAGEPLTRTDVEKAQAWFPTTVVGIPAGRPTVRPVTATQSIWVVDVDPFDGIPSEVWADTEQWGGPHELSAIELAPGDEGLVKVGHAFIGVSYRGEDLPDGRSTAEAPAHVVAIHRGLGTEGAPIAMLRHTTPGGGRVTWAALRRVLERHGTDVRTLVEADKPLPTAVGRAVLRLWHPVAPTSAAKPTVEV